MCKHLHFPDNCDTKPSAFFERIWLLRQKRGPATGRAKLAKRVHDRNSRGSVERIAQLGDDPVFQSRGVKLSERRRLFLEKLLPAGDAGGIPTYSESMNSKPPDLGAASRHRRMSEVAIPASEALTTWRQSVRGATRTCSLPSSADSDCFFLGRMHRFQGPLGSADKWSLARAQKCRLRHDIASSWPSTSDHSYQSPGEKQSPDLASAKSFWKEAMIMVESARIPPSLPEFTQRIETYRNLVDKATAEERTTDCSDCVICD